MTVPLETRKASLDRVWQPLTDEHKDQLERAEDTIADFGRGEVVDPLAIVGAYRSGKTQLLYHLFNTAWEQGIPAFYISDPGKMMTSFAAADETDLNDWIRSEIDIQLAAYASGRSEDVLWFPNVSTQTKERFVGDRGGAIDTDETVRTALLFDEVEQSYKEFIRVLDKDDKNPLRKINDGLQDSVKVWSFGMISAFEFIGEADWGRLREVRIPPLGVADVRDLLNEQRPDLVPLANVLWWLARGRTGLIIKLIDQLPDNIDSDAVSWLRDLAETDFRETRLIDNRWVNLDSQDWEPAIRALLFLENGLNEWQITDDTALTATQCSKLAVNIIKEEYSFEEASEDHQSAQGILDRNLNRVLSGLAVSESALFPTLGLADPDQADAMLSLVSDMIVSFEPAGQPRTVAIEAIDGAKGAFHTRWEDQVATKRSRNKRITTAAPTKVQSAFPPIAVNPERISDRDTADLEATMERGLTVDTSAEISDSIRVAFCPTAETFEAEQTAVTESYDITAPTVLVIPEDHNFEIDNTVNDMYQRHDLLKIQTHKSNRFWKFILNFFGRLDGSEAFADPYRVNPAKLTDVLESCTEREIRNTVETLYDQLRQVAVDQGETLARQYREAYSLADSEALLWNESRLNGMKPFWSSGKFVESTVALSYLLVLCPEYESDRAYAGLHEPLTSGIENDLVPTGASGFQFKSYLDNLFTQSSYSKTITSEREHYRVNGELAPAVQHLRDALSDLVSHAGSTDVIQHLDDPQVSIGDEDLPTVPNGLTHLGYGLFRALLISALVDGADAEIDIAARLSTVENMVTEEVETLQECRDEIQAFDDRFNPPASADVGNWVSIDTDELDQYEDNFVALLEGIRDLVSKVSSDPSAGSVGYHYWFLLHAYLETIRPEISDFASEIPPGNVAAIMEAADAFDDCYHQVATDEFIKTAFNDRQQVVTQLEKYGKEAFDLKSHLQSTSLALSLTDDMMLQQVGPGDESVIPETATDIETLYLPEHTDALRAVNREMANHKTTLESLKNTLQTIESNVEALDNAVAESNERLTQLLSPPDNMEVSDE